MRAGIMEFRLQIEEEIARLPILQYAFLRTDQIPFSPGVREICREECPRYGKSWSCPPAVGSVAACREQSLKYAYSFVFSTIAEETDLSDMGGMLLTRKEHERIAEKVGEIFRAHDPKALLLSAQSCEKCAQCTYPSAPCRYPDQMYPCVESYGILVPELARICGMDFTNGGDTLTWFGLILFHSAGENPDFRGNSGFCGSAAGTSGCS